MGEARRTIPRTLAAAWRRAEELLWEAPGGGAAARALRVTAVSLWKFREDRCFLRASALTYATLLSLVPLLALAFSVLKGFGVQRRLEPLVLEHLAAGNQEIVTRILEYVDRTQVGSLGVAGLLGLLLTAVSVLGNVELSFNDIWRVRRGRNVLRKLTDYVTLLVVTPVLLLASLSLTTTLHAPALVGPLALLGPALRMGLRALPFLSIWVAFTGAYLILPNRRVPLRAALLGGAVAGALWQTAEWGYIRFQFGMVRYNAIYGTMAQLPMLLVWLYTSWCLVLLGAELACVSELPGAGRSLRRGGSLWAPRAEVALAALVAVARRFQRAEEGHRQADLEEELGLVPGEGEALLERLAQAGLVTATHDDPPRWVPARAPDRTPAPELVRLAAGLAGGAVGLACVRLDRGLAREFEGLTWEDLAEEPPA